MNRDLVWLSDVIAACQRVARFVGDRSKPQFMADDFLLSAVVRQLEIIGEAVKRLSTPFREAYPEVPWQKMAGLRDVLIHAYDDVDLDLLWRIVRESLPEAERACEAILRRQQD